MKRNYFPTSATTILSGFALTFLLGLFTSCDKLGSDSTVPAAVEEKKKQTEREIASLKNNQSNYIADQERINRIVSKAATLKPAGQIDLKVIRSWAGKTVKIETVVETMRFKSGEFLRCFDTIMSDIDYQEYTPYFDTTGTTLDIRLSQFYNTNTMFGIRNYLYPSYYEDEKQFSFDEIRHITTMFSTQNLQQRIGSFRSFVNKEQIDIKKKVDNCAADIAKKEEYMKRLDQDFADLRKMSINRMLISIALPIFGIIILGLMLIPRWYNDKDIRKAIFEKELLLQLITIFLLTVTILILGIGDKLSKEVLGTLLGGISVYVLQRTTRSKDPDKET